MEVVNEKGETSTINHIVNGMKGNNTWSSFRLTMKTKKKNEKPATIDELKEMMTNYEHALENENDNHRDNIRWKFPNHRRNHARNHDRATKWRRQVYTDVSDEEMDKTYHSSKNLYFQQYQHTGRGNKEQSFDKNGRHKNHYNRQGTQASGKKRDENTQIQQLQAQIHDLQA